ncbi:MAG: response regulator [Acidobacteriota bacterium]
MANLSYKASPISSTHAASQVSPPSAPLVLIIEDHEDTRFMLRTILELSGLRVTEAGDGEAGLRAAEEQRPDLVLMDSNLPRMDGLTTTRLIRERESGRNLPVIIVSGRADPASQKAAFAAGCDWYLVKPIDFDELDRLLRSCLNLKET